MLELIDYLFYFIQIKITIVRFKVKRYYLPKGIIKNYNLIINGKKLL